MIKHVIEIHQTGEHLNIVAHRVKSGIVTRAELDYSNKVALFIDRYNEIMRLKGAAGPRSLDDIVGEALEKHASSGSSDPTIPLPNED